MILYKNAYDLLSRHSLCQDALLAFQKAPVAEVYGVETLYDKTHIHAWMKVEDMLRAVLTPVPKSDWHYECDDDCGSRARMLNTLSLLSVE